MCPEATTSAPTIEDIDQALKYAVETRTKTIDFKKHIIDEFINELLDERSRLSK